VSELAKPCRRRRRRRRCRQHAGQQEGRWPDALQPGHGLLGGS
jgi:hypothetical protein